MDGVLTQFIITRRNVILMSSDSSKKSNRPKQYVVEYLNYCHDDYFTTEGYDPSEFHHFVFIDGEGKSVQGRYVNMSPVDEKEAKKLQDGFNYGLEHDLRWKPDATVTIDEVGARPSFKIVTKYVFNSEAGMARVAASWLDKDVGFRRRNVWAPVRAETTAGE